MEWSAVDPVAFRGRTPPLDSAREDGRADEGDGLENGLMVRRCADCAA